MQTYFNIWQKREMEWDPATAPLFVRLVGSEDRFFVDADGVRRFLDLGYGTMSGPKTEETVRPFYFGLLERAPWAKGHIEVVRAACVFSNYESHIPVDIEAGAGEDPAHCRCAHPDIHGTSGNTCLRCGGHWRCQRDRQN
jgi:hypothetical protein